MTKPDYQKALADLYEYLDTLTISPAGETTSERYARLRKLEEATKTMVMPLVWACYLTQEKPVYGPTAP